MTVLCEKLLMHFPKGTLAVQEELMSSAKGLSKLDRPLRVDSDEPLEVDHVDLNAFEGECDHPFPSSTCLRRIAVKRTRLMILMLILLMDPAEPRKQTATHINVASEEVSRSTGEQREKVR